MHDRRVWYNCECGDVVTATWLDRLYEPDYYVDAHYGAGPGGVCEHADGPVAWDRVLPRAEWGDCPTCDVRWVGGDHDRLCPWASAV